MKYRTISRSRIAEYVADERARRWRVLKEALPEYFLTKEGFFMCLNPEDSQISRIIALDGEYNFLDEAPITQMLKRLVTKSTIFVDGGANLGWFTFLCASRAKKVYAFEPTQTTADLTAKALLKNGYENVVFQRKALSDFVGPATFYVSRNLPGGNSLVRGGLESASVECTTLDREVVDAEGELILKLDVEGAEPAVLRGAQRLLSSGRVKHIFMEYTASSWKERSLIERYDAFEVSDGRPFNFEVDIKNVHLVLRR